jgi:hypothetical protein
MGFIGWERNAQVDIFCHRSATLTEKLVEGDGAQEEVEDDP